MASFPGLPGALSLLQAQAASFNKGQEVNTSHSKDRLEKNREARQMLFKTKQAEDQQKTDGAQKGFLA